MRMRGLLVGWGGGGRACMGGSGVRGQADPPPAPTGDCQLTGIEADIRCAQTDTLWLSGSLALWLSRALELLRLRSLPASWGLRVYPCASRVSLCRCLARSLCGWMARHGRVQWYVSGGVQALRCMNLTAVCCATDCLGVTQGGQRGVLCARLHVLGRCATGLQQSGAPRHPRGDPPPCV